MQPPLRDLRFMLAAVLAPAGFWALTDANAADATSGSVFPIATNPAAIELAGGGAFDGTNLLVAMTTATASSIDIAAQFVSPSGTLINTQIVVATGVSGQPPAAAFGVSNYLVRWRNNLISSGPNVFGQLITPVGAKVGSAFPITQGTGTGTKQREGSVVFGGTNFLALWHDTANANYTLYGQFVSPAGALVGPPLTIASLGDDGTDTGMSFDGTNFLAAWYSLRATSQRDIYAAIISQAGTFVVPPFLVSESVSADRNGVSVGFDGSNYFCVWSQDIPTNNPPLWHLNGRLVSPSGAFPGNELALTTSTNAQVVPFLAFDGVNYLLNWGDAYATPNANIRFQFLNRSAQAVGPSFMLFSSVGTNPPVLGAALFDGTRLDAFADIGTILLNGGQTTASAVYGISIPASDARPTLYPVPPFTNAQFRVRLEGTPGIIYAIQVATSLLPTDTVWTALTTNSPTNLGTFDYTDTHATNSSRLYRGQRL